MKTAAFEDWTDKARAVKIEDELARRGVKLRGTIDQCGPCPKCGGEDRFSINIQKQVFNCRQCAIGGDVIKLVEHVDGCDFITACTTLTGEPPSKPTTSNKNREAWTLVAEHIYQDANGHRYLRVRKCRDGSGRKQYPQAHWDGMQWMKGKPKGPKVPYRLPQLIAAPLTATIYFVEGEKDADSLAKLDFVATTASEGAGAKWDFELTKWFKDRHVVILPDADKPGRNHAQKVAKAIDRLAASVQVVDLYPDCRDGSDVSDWLRDDPSGARLAKLVQDAPLWEPGADSGQDDGKASSHSDTSPSDVSGTLLRKKQADVLIGLADAAYLFHTPTHDAYADVTKADHRETYRVRSKPFRSWLAHRFYVAIKGAPNSEAMQSALGVIEARAVFDGPEIAVQVRVAGQAGKLYLDLADEKWRAVEIDADGWRVISSPPVRFRRAAGMLALPEPVSGGSINALRPLINVRKGKDGDVDFVLVVAWLLAVLRDVGPYPVLGLSGEHGVAKSMMSRLLRALIDPNTAPLRALPREDRDLFITANNGLVLGFDNVSGIPPWISDTLCRLATGGGFSVRQLYTDDSEMLFDAMRPAILNGIEDVATRPDLADRAILLTLEIYPRGRPAVRARAMGSVR